jgi:hypothetical protein
MCTMFAQVLDGWTLAERTNVGGGTALESERKRWPSGTSVAGSTISRFQLAAGAYSVLCATQISAAFKALNFCDEEVTWRYNGDDAIVLADSLGARLVRCFQGKAFAAWQHAARYCQGKASAACGSMQRCVPQSRTR